MQAEDNVVELRREREAPVEPQGFEELFLDRHDRLFRALYFMTGSRDDAEELMQDAFLKLWERWNSNGAIDDPVAWLFRVSLNGFRMRTRRARVAARRLVPMTSPRDPFEDVNIREDVRRMLRSFPQRQRSALVLTGDLRLQLGTGGPDPRGPADHRPRARPAGAGGDEGDVRRPR